MGIGGPDEGLAIGIVFLDEAIDGGLKVDDGAEDAALQPSSGQLGEEALDGVEPGGRGRGEVECPAGMAGEPGAHPRVLVSGIVIADRMDELAGRNCRLDGVEEADELLMAMALHALADDGAVEHVEAANSVVVPLRL